ncbi:MAG: bifunctional demethylmenaquinone methyltransferase/2-methoxy-6-polyprenyl-1,4-benzoquinol methylase [Cellulomonas sp. 73-92]|uniref:demethylmenaquinone methyltransferase n=1 Tax=Cellulomonas sp. 73-92 TaxID=1895740 RepID=UPI000929C8F7|nr:demethylmenaquinone methyltransferase [Cellulomonas sp. 73-92]OJV78586.1 MAG: bifunctional demethylmenaquinone methyltransferase/2-methoxy-6-polyprenyl-1,4-benzoquinol methylase [Cellulomonas sp. 73-92]
MPRAGLDKDTRDVAAMFDAVADRYDLTNDVLSMFQDRSWRRATLDALGVGRGDRVLDLAAGTGTSAVPLADRGVRVVACDLSLGMLQVGHRKRPDIAFVAGDAGRLPFADESFDAVTISFGLRNVPDVDGALEEMLRVTRPGGRVVICEFSRPTNKAFRAVYDQYLSKALPRIAGVVAKESDAYTYLADTIAAWPEQRELGVKMRAAGWASVAYRNLSGGIVALHRGFRPSPEGV